MVSSSFVVDYDNLHDKGDLVWGDVNWVGRRKAHSTEETLDIQLVPSFLLPLLLLRFPYFLPLLQNSACQVSLSIICQVITQSSPLQVI
ncbi:hypothetical protein B9Z55_013346 [Caenorhabditis nigoni]|uniref:Uncharacterized protein n=1 Tax=Caenorhabditis nigoni TaxID=1611254 RepID=A0A2G5U1J5_9PELO|nr:hypothetical protein B9Z55_013346 [Caenorhabditis nigoni]